MVAEKIIKRTTKKGRTYETVRVMTLGRRRK